MTGLQRFRSLLREAWERLTPGRRRGWLLHFTAAKQSKTRVVRIERATPRILEDFGCTTTSRELFCLGSFRTPVWGGLPSEPCCRAAVPMARSPDVGPRVCHGGAQRIQAKT
jgi:bacteriocin resistance YdeI/OmpD-like protein